MLPSSALRRTLLRRFSHSAAARTATTADVLSLESCIARSESSRALEALDRLPQDAKEQDPQLLQRLALLVAKRGQPHEAPRAAQILRSLMSQSHFAADDITQLAAIYTLDACLQHQQLADALQLVDVMQQKDVMVDLPAVDALLRALVDAGRVDEAVAMLKKVTPQCPPEQTFEPVLLAVMHQRKYEDVLALIDLGRENLVDFSPETYDPLVELSQEQYNTENKERLGLFMEYVNDALREDGYWDDEEYWDEDFDEDDEDDDDEDGEDFDDDDFEEEFD